MLDREERSKTGRVSATEDFTMKYPIVSAVFISTVVFTISPVSAKMMSCSGDDMSRMTTMIGGMPDGPHKWEMYKHLSRINSAIAKDGVRGCAMTMKNMMSGSKMSMMKSGM